MLGPRHTSVPPCHLALLLSLLTQTHSSLPPPVDLALTQGRIPAAAQQQSDSQDLGMRRDLDTMMAQITALSSVVHSVLAQQGQQQNAAAPQLRATARSKM